MAFTLTHLGKDQDGIVLVSSAGDATSFDFPSDHHWHFDTLLGTGWNSHLVLLDMDQTAYLESSAIGWLISCQKQFRQGGGRLVIHSVQPHIRNMLDMLKIDRVVPIAASASAGRKILLSLAAMEQTA